MQLQGSIRANFRNFWNNIVLPFRNYSKYLFLSLGNFQNFMFYFFPKIGTFLAWKPLGCVSTFQFYSTLRYSLSPLGYLVSWRENIQEILTTFTWQNILFRRRKFWNVHCEEISEREELSEFNLLLTRKFLSWNLSGVSAS